MIQKHEEGTEYYKKYIRVVNGVARRVYDDFYGNFMHDF